MGPTPTMVPRRLESRLPTISSARSATKPEDASVASIGLHLKVGEFGRSGLDGKEWSVASDSKSIEENAAKDSASPASASRICSFVIRRLCASPSTEGTGKRGLTRIPAAHFVSSSHAASAPASFAADVFQ